MLHEARHAYQAAQASIAGNDPDGDFLVNNIAIAPTAFFLDSTNSRTVCNLSAGRPGSTMSLGYRGSSIFDYFGAPDNAEYAFEKDAVAFSSTHII